MDSFFYNLNQSHYSTYLRFKTIWTIRETVCGLSLVTLHPVVGGLNDSDWRHKDYDPMKNLSRQLESLDWPRCWVGLGLMIIINNITISEGKNTRNKIVFSTTTTNPPHRPHPISSPNVWVPQILGVVHILRNHGWGGVSPNDYSIT